MADLAKNKKTTQGVAHPIPAFPRNPNFRGLCLFGSQNSASLAAHPDIAATNLVYYWSQIEIQQGRYDWGVVDADIAAWKAHGKKVILRVSPAGWVSWNKPWSHQGTPQWVYDLGVPFMTEVDGAVLPQYWHALFLQHYSEFIQAFAQRYDGDPTVAVVQIAVGVGGETKVDTRRDNPNMLTEWQAIGYSDQLWLQTIIAILNAYDKAFVHTPLVVMPDSSFIAGTHGYGEGTILDYAAKIGIGVQNNGLIVGQPLTSPAWQHVPFILSEQRKKTAQSGDTLQQDIQQGMLQRARYILIFEADISTQGAQLILHQAALRIVP